MDPVFRLIDSVIPLLLVFLMIGCGGIAMAALSATKVIQDSRGWWKQAWFVALVAALINFVITIYPLVQSGIPRHWHWRDVLLQLIIVVGITLVTAALGRWLFSHNSTSRARVVVSSVATLVMFPIAFVLMYIFRAPNDFDYQHFVLTDGMEAVEYGQTELRNMHAHSDMPIRYKLKRDQYILYATVETWAQPHRPTVIFSVEGKTLVDTSIKGAATNHSQCIVEINSYEYEEHGYTAGSAGFVWAGTYHPVCENDDGPLKRDGKFKIPIFDGTGQKVAVEVIPFEIVTNGFQRVYDSL